MNEKPKILVIDDEIDMLKSTCKILNASKYEAQPLVESKLAESTLTNNKFDLILCDLLMPDIDGLAIIELAKRKNIDTPIIIFSAYGTVDRAVNCIKAGAYDFIEKPFEAEHLLLIIERAIKYSQIFQERNELLNRLGNANKFDNIIGKSSPMIKIFKTIKNLSQSDANIVITGESGTGKELLARSIHLNSKRSNKAFVPVNCGALPENLFESEIFGYEKGAFTGADTKKIGLLEYANYGTFFLDEVGELPLNLQIKLLRVIQDGKLRRLGGNELINIDVRIVSATNRKLEDLISAGIFRKDLFYRINVINIHLPPLRERKDDIQLLANYFLKQNIEKSKKEIKGIDSEVIKIFKNYDWPGNIRELENIIERGVALTNSNYLSVSDLPDHLLSHINNKKSFNNTSLKEARKAAIEDVEKQFLYYMLEKYSGNISKIAEENEMTRRNTYHLLKRYNIDPDSWRNN